MRPGPGFDCDGEFHKLLSRREDVDLTLAALEIARDAQPGLDFGPTLDWIDARARELAGPVALARTERSLLEHFGQCLAQTHGVFGDLEHYNRPESSYLNRVIETRRGIPISLSVLYTAVAERLGVALEGVAAPLHFLMRYDSVDGPLFLDAFHRGRLMTRPQVLDWLRSMTGLTFAQLDPTLRAVGPRTILVRMLNNLKGLHVRNGDWAAAWNVQHRLAALQPASFEERRDLAVISLRTNRPGHAVELLECCLKSCPEEERVGLRSQLAEARTKLAQCN